LRGYYLASARELVKDKWNNKDTCYEYAAETMLGVVTTRAFGMIGRFFSCQSKTYRH